jgi:hypothetical protein
MGFEQRFRGYALKNRSIGDVFCHPKKEQQQLGF